MEMKMRNNKIVMGKLKPKNDRLENKLVINGVHTRDPNLLRYNNKQNISINT